MITIIIMAENWDNFNMDLYLKVLRAKIATEQSINPNKQQHEHITIT